MGQSLFLFGKHFHECVYMVAPQVPAHENPQLEVYKYVKAGKVTLGIAPDRDLNLEATEDITTSHILSNHKLTCMHDIFSGVVQISESFLPQNE